MSIKRIDFEVCAEPVMLVKCVYRTRIDCEAYGEPVMLVKCV